MARTSLIEDLFRLASEVPWWLALAMGGGFFYTFKVYIPARMALANQTAFTPLFAVLAYGFLGICVLGVLAGLVRRWREHAVFKRQTSLDSVRRLSWQDFERLVVTAFRRDGFEAERTAAGADGGIDIVLTMDGESRLVQCKHWKRRRIGVKPIRELAGVVAAQHAAGGIFVCSGTYTKEAVRFAEHAGIELVDGDRLAMMIGLDTEISTTAHAVNTERTRADNHCPRCGSRLVRRVARRGPHSGEAFLGCDAFPKCRYTRND